MSSTKQDMPTIYIQDRNIELHRWELLQKSHNILKAYKKYHCQN